MKAHENPFSAAALAEIRYRLPKGGLDALLARVEAERGLWALAGPEGTGKTTLLEDIGNALEERGRSTSWIRLQADSSRAERSAALAQIYELAPREILLLDGGETFSRLDWWRLRPSLRRTGGLILATLHQARGFPVLHRTRPDWPEAQRCIERLAGQPLAESLQAAAYEGFVAGGGNMREVFRRCYLECARR